MKKQLLSMVLFVSASMNAGFSDLVSGLWNNVSKKDAYLPKKWAAIASLAGASYALDLKGKVLYAGSVINTHGLREGLSTEVKSFLKEDFSGKDVAVAAAAVTAAAWGAYYLCSKGYTFLKDEYSIKPKLETLKNNLDKLNSRDVVAEWNFLNSIYDFNSLLSKNGINFNDLYRTKDCSEETVQKIQSMQLKFKTVLRKERKAVRTAGNLCLKLVSKLAKTNQQSIPAQTPQQAATAGIVVQVSKQGGS